ncbi:MAG: TIGR00159 family protein [Bacteroidales bacterium]|nr:TIGR00159 family protein [Bacteroidales bacterium]
MITAFITIRFLDILDILLVAFLLYQIYNLIRGTTAINIFIGISTLYLLWLLVKALNMNLLSSILGQVIGVGVIALIIVFQPEVRRFLLIISTRYIRNRKFSLEKLFSFGEKDLVEVNIDSIVSACSNMSAFKTGALIAISKRSDLMSFIRTGDVINADTSSRLLESIFFKNSPLHDGAVIITKDKIAAARCVLPATDKIDLPPQFGMRHRAALGIAEKTDAVVILVSEETGAISFAKEEDIETNIGPNRLRQILEKEFSVD